MCDELCHHDFHPFLYTLNDVERQTIVDKANAVHNLYYNFPPPETPKPELSLGLYSPPETPQPELSLGMIDLMFLEIVRDVKNYNSVLNPLYFRLANFFSENPEQFFFLRLSSISPKDAYTFMCPCNDDCDDEEIITRSINFLKVGVTLFQSPEKTAEHCIQLLCHSERIKLDIQFEETKRLSVLLLPWKFIKIKNETRCFIKNGILIGISQVTCPMLSSLISPFLFYTQYYEDLSDCYEDVPKLYDSIITFFNSMQQSFPLQDITVDLNIVESKVVEIIEYNQFKDSDKCFFSNDDLDELEKSSLSQSQFSPPFRYVDSKRYSEGLEKCSEGKFSDIWVEFPSC
eukprot:TRINITY_DN4789_c0_g2_i6.p1 TRINITY_DN4789_c0_g2~~TRINITY_DN4789_c0_g2_i6.p1  ORF type:complete len:389 (-),score=59.32 TRINITY_DN4789_c0_g2_i6:222-1256(-)